MLNIIIKFCIYLIFIHNCLQCKRIRYRDLDDLETELQGLRAEVTTDFSDKQVITDYRELSNKEIVKRLNIILNKIDQNHDDKFSRYELTTWIEKVDHFLDVTKVLNEWTKNNPKQERHIHWTDYMDRNHGTTKHEHIIEPFDEHDLRRDYRRWRLVDRNGDGNLTMREFYNFVHARKHPVLEPVLYTLEEVYQYDRNGDAFISFREYAEQLFRKPLEDIKKTDVEWLRGRFKKHDVDEDGVLDFSEQRTFFKICHYGEKTAVENAELFIELFDSNKNQVLTRQEILAQFYDVQHSWITGDGEILIRYKEMDTFVCDDCIQK